jgi:hypothetical protein
LGRLVVVKEALGHVEEVGTIQSHLRKAAEQSLEVRGSGLVGTDILGGDDRVEGDAKAPVAGGKGCPVDIGDDDQPEVVGEPG